jgi:phthiodiolone/phenolphthiodiolone dimycocerosates ketoreductase
MELGIHLVAAGDLSNAIERYARCMLQVVPDCVWLSDRLMVDDYSALIAYCGQENVEREPPPQFLDPFLTAAALAQRLPQQPRFGIAVTDFIRRAAPDLARAACTLNQMLQTPINMGFGAGEAINLTPLGYRHGPKPVSHMESSLQQFRQINENGRYFVSPDRLVELGYNSHPSPVWVGGQRNRMLRITARYGDGWLPAWKMTPLEYGNSAALLRELAAAENRACPVLGMFAMPIIGRSKAELLAYFSSSPLARAVALMASAELWEKWGLEHPAGSNSKGLFDVVLDSMPAEKLYNALVSVPAEMIADILFLGNLQELLDEFWQFKVAGLQHLSLLLPDFDNPRISYGVDDFDIEFNRLCREIKSW